MSNDEVGFKKPPKSGQFKKGKSGNPSGRPKTRPKQEQAADIVDRILFQEMVPVTDKKGRRSKIIVFEAAFKRLAQMALTSEPNPRALSQLLKVYAEVKGKDATRQKAPLPWNDDDHM